MTGKTVSAQKMNKKNKMNRKNASRNRKEFEEYEEDTDEDFCSPSSREHSLEAEGDLDSIGSGETEEEDSDFD